MFLSVLGTPYEIIKRKYTEDEAFEQREISGYCSEHIKQIVCCDMATYPGWERETPQAASNCEKQVLRHEIVHAFFNESGLGSNALSCPEPWATNEEMVDWIAAQGPKLYAAWQEAGAL